MKRRFITRNKSKDGLIYFWTATDKKNLVLSDGIWESQSDMDYRSVIGTAEQFKRLFIRRAPQKGSLSVIDQLSIVVNHKRWGKII